MAESDSKGLGARGAGVLAIHASPLPRARETAERIAARLPGVPVVESDLLAEGDPCEHTPTSKHYRPTEWERFAASARIEAAFRRFFWRWVGDESKDDADRSKDGGGAPAPYKYTAQQGSEWLPPSVLEAFLAQGDDESSLATAHEPPRVVTEIVVCHGNVIRYCVLRALQLPPEAWLRTAAWNCSMTTLEVRPDGGVSLHAFGDKGHLPASKVTYS